MIRDTGSRDLGGDGHVIRKRRELLLDLNTIELTNGTVSIMFRVSTITVQNHQNSDESAGGRSRYILV